MEYEKKYKEALKWVQKLYPSFEGWVKEDAEHYFPELKENEDDRIRKAIYNALKYLEFELSWDFLDEVDILDAYAWLEKQGEQPTDKIEPNFKVGDWIISNNKKSIYQVIEVKRGIYVIRDNADNHEYYIDIEECEKSGRLWSISDARDGDILACNKEILLFKSASALGYISLHCWYNGQTNRFHSKAVYDTLMTTRNKICPATKEQQDLFIQKMKEAGYEWDAEKKELKKIEPKKLDPDKVIEWLERNSSMFWDSPCNPSRIVELFKKDFEI